MANTREKAIEMLGELRHLNFSDYEILDYIICNHLNSDDACEVLEGFAEDNDISFKL